MCVSLYFLNGICQQIDCHPKKPSARKIKVGKEVKEVIEPEVNRAKFSTKVEETISTNSDDFLDADRDLEYIYFGSDTERETDN